MSPALKHKLVRYLSKKQSGKGFTLLELLVVVMVVGILAAIALPNLIGQVGKARQTEGEVAIGTFMRAQQTFHVENRSFETNIASLNGLETVNPLGIIFELNFYSSGTINSSADETTISLGNPSATPALGIRLLEGELEFENGTFISVICQSATVNDPTPPSADPSPFPQCGSGEQI